ncbi:sodium/proline symporter PutP [Jeotgalibacillus marinus]|uniref:Sodium/proline symporter n=1 Tax=Jeotgalibacillus marinus TaxID=86667 RepID=A0ABV3PZ00_9BACL
MEVEIEIYFLLVLYFIAMLGIGLYGYKKSTGDLSQYMLGGRKLGPAVTALSAGASVMSGWTLLSLPGTIYVSGLSGMWIAVALSIGAYLNYIFVAPRLRTYTEVANNSITIPDYFENRFSDDTKILRFISAIVIIIFFTVYTSSGMVAGGVLFESAFGFDYLTGLIITTSVVLVYTLFGGFLAVSMTDFVQGCIMVIALILVPIVAFSELGGISSTFNTIKDIDPTLTSFFQGTTVLGFLGLMAWGLGYFGQPHIIVRFMAIRNVKSLKTARHIGITWTVIANTGAVLTGLTGLAYITTQGEELKNPETIFIVFSHVLFHPLISGFLLAAVLAAIMSSISSQLLVTSSALTEDFYNTFLKRKASDKELVFVGRASVFLVAIVAIFLSLDSENTILDLVSNAWAGFGSAFGPAIILSLYWKEMNRWGAIAGIFVGAITVILWIYVFQLSAFLYEMIPGFILSLLAIIVVSKMTGGADKITREGYNAFEKVHEVESNK